MFEPLNSFLIILQQSHNTPKTAPNKIEMKNTRVDGANDIYNMAAYLNIFSMKFKWLFCLLLYANSSIFPVMFSSPFEVLNLSMCSEFPFMVK